MGKKGVLVQPHGLREEGQGDGSREAREPHHRDENLPPPEHHDPPSRGQSPPPTSRLAAPSRYLRRLHHTRAQTLSYVSLALG